MGCCFHEGGEYEAAFVDLAAYFVQLVDDIRSGRYRVLLVTALVQDGLTQLDRASSEAVAQVEDPRDQLRALGLAYIRFAVAHPAQFRIMFRPELSHPPAVSDLEHGPVFDVLMTVVDELSTSHLICRLKHGPPCPPH
ncbi:WHG domain-containing protein [Deinococcus sp. Arct2-2]|uniref:TetR-like C-terminal domain-containing protein n=1 Tax=Deinococcus sp. Arct2-2 TaxID=2568653 RepID=UPI0010A4B317|nr:TetR-like C-terminal domain-containing protein [Deinococcus sp. Arct2-2]THF66718.1 WHG domain-containing protein [Deinococcus sp. Arct2-2]